MNTKVGLVTVMVIREYVGRSGQVIVWEGTDLGKALERAMLEQVTIGATVRHLIECEGTEGAIVVSGDAKRLAVAPKGEIKTVKAARR